MRHVTLLWRLHSTAVHYSTKHTATARRFTWTSRGTLWGDDLTTMLTLNGYSDSYVRTTFNNKCSPQAEPFNATQWTWWGYEDKYCFNSLTLHVEWWWVDISCLGGWVANIVPIKILSWDWCINLQRMKRVRLINWIYIAAMPHSCIHWVTWLGLHTWTYTALNVYLPY